MKTITDLLTPCLILEEAILLRNLDRMSTIAINARVDLRPHCKTAKSSDVARRATEKHSGAITVSTLREAEYFAENGFTDILYAVGIVPSKLERIAALQERNVTITVLLDSVEMAQSIANAGVELPRSLPVLIEIDAELGRTGVQSCSVELLEIGSIINAAASLELAGVLAFGGIGYIQDTVEGIRDAAERVRIHAVRAADRLRAANLPCDIVSIGSTPTRLMGESLEGITEIRPGVYVFMDLMQATLGVCGYDDIAVTVLASVIGHNHEKQRVYIDAGALALSKDHGIARISTLR